MSPRDLDTCTDRRDGARLKPRGAPELSSYLEHDEASWGDSEYVEYLSFCTCIWEIFILVRELNVLHSQDFDLFGGLVE